MIVWLASYPRSGNSFLRTALYAHFGCRSATKYHLNEGEGRSEYKLRTPLSLGELAASRDLYFVKTHDLPARDDFPAIYQVRDGRDSLLSYAWRVLEKEQGLNRTKITPRAFRAMLTNLMTSHRSPFGTWSSNAAAWYRRPRTVHLRFEEMIRTPALVVDAIRRLGLDLAPLPNPVMPTFTQLHQARPGSFRQGKEGAWKQEFPADLLAEFWALHGKMMDRLGYHAGNPAVRAAVADAARLHQSWLGAVAAKCQSAYRLFR